MKPSRTTFLSMVALALTLPNATQAADYLQKSIAAYDAKDCAPVVEQELDKEKIDRDKISKIDYIKDVISDSESGEEYNYQGWVSFKGCGGNYVVNMNRYCQIKTTFATGSCKIENLRKIK
ncbi:MAG: hypothetical protein EP348_05200 [Alphaproteobacteria bacterium]|nr:MAG: hypothetical protein EP348_05200 [Alphaproteobacteria bacterium]